MAREEALREHQLRHDPQLVQNCDLDLGIDSTSGGGAPAPEPASATPIPLTRG
ncbi:MAG: hypothetical protein IPJ58_07860 [Ardenticatenia bacterium]|nr:hypothetical protein [Ardenticatenia bacterium]MBK8538594.1 hypothetical protein [Ardenticatenia bacterium]